MTDHPSLSDSDLAVLQHYDPCYQPVCYICTSTMIRCGYGTPKPKQGLHQSPSYHDKSIWRHEAWFQYFRMSQWPSNERVPQLSIACCLVLFHPKKPICHLSGTSYLTSQGYGRTLQVPWDEDTLAARPTLQDRKRDLFATALSLNYGGQAVPDRLAGIVMHHKCWEILKAHRVWDICKQDIGVILELLRLRRLKTWPMERSQGGFYPLQSIVTHYGVDLYAEPQILRLIHRARRRISKRFKIRKTVKKTYFSRLPLEILLEIADPAGVQDVEHLQRAMQVYLGDYFWRSRIPLEHLRVLPLVDGEDLDWQFLCVGLKRLGSDFWKERLEGRQSLDKSLEELTSLLKV
ncbi:hypothetical protein BDV18DRAFT_158272 [Aspergillus unguis]